MTAAQMNAHKRLWEHAQRGSGQSAVVCQFLMNLFDGESNRFDLCDLRWIDDQIFLDFVTILELEHVDFQQEVHKRLGLTETQFLKALGRE